jgi:hypothetical protein
VKLYALTIHQPYASMIVDRRKRIETRTWPTWYRGLLAIHAAKRPRVGDLPRRAIVAVAELVDVVPVETLTQLDPVERELGDYRPGRFAWRLVDVRPVPPIECRGHQGLWPVDPALVARVLRAAGRQT